MDGGRTTVWIMNHPVLVVIIMTVLAVSFFALCMSVFNHYLDELRDQDEQVDERKSCLT